MLNINVKVFKVILLVFIASFIFGCSNEKHQIGKIIRMGTIAGPETQLMQTVQAVLKKTYNLDMKIVIFTDYTMPNQALADGSIDINMFQTLAYFDADVKARHLPLAIVGKTFIYPMAIYSKKIKDIAEVPDQATVAIPNDPSNETRALLLLEKASLITLNKNVGQLVTTLNIASNPKNLIIKPIDAAQLPRILPDVTMAAINTNFAIPAGLSSRKDSIYVEESKDSPYVNIVVARSDDANDPRIQQIVAALHSKEVVAAAEKLFNGEAIPAWDNAPQ